MGLDAASKKMLTDMGFDVPGLEKAITTTGDQAYKLTPKTGPTFNHATIYPTIKAPNTRHKRPNNRTHINPLPTPLS